MSRRTRLGFLALFLGLTAVPMVYLFLTWAPEEPLRFRLTRASGQAHAAIPLYEVEVVNTRGVPIRLRDGILWLDHGGESSETSSTGAPAPGRTPFFAQFDIAAALHGGSSHPGSTARVVTTTGYRIFPSHIITIPSHGTRRIPIRILEGPGLIPQDGQLRLRYIWISQPRHLTDQSISWLRTQVPALSRHLPHLTPEDTTAIVEFHRADLAPIHPTAGQGRVASTATSTSTSATTSTSADVSAR
jgi:hypothetical protein